MKSYRIRRFNETEVLLVVEHMDGFKACMYAADLLGLEYRDLWYELEPAP